MGRFGWFGWFITRSSWVLKSLWFNDLIPRIPHSDSAPVFLVILWIVYVTVSVRVPSDSLLGQSVGAVERHGEIKPCWTRFWHFFLQQKQQWELTACLPKFKVYIPMVCLIIQEFRSPTWWNNWALMFDTHCSGCGKWILLTHCPGEMMWNLLDLGVWEESPWSGRYDRDTPWISESFVNHGFSFWDTPIIQSIYRWLCKSALRTLEFLSITHH